MIRIQTILMIVAVAFFASCKKSDEKPRLQPGSVSLDKLAISDTLLMNMHAGHDSAVAIGFKAILNGNVSNANHVISIRIDTSRMRDFRAKYGNARVLPAANYLLYRPMVDIKPGTAQSDAILVNVIKQSVLRQFTDYVLPVLIDEIDGVKVSPGEEEVLFLVIKTGKATSISKIDWTIHSFSSQLTNSYPPTNLLDNSTGTKWMSGAGMPQYVAFNFGDEVIFSGVTYTPDLPGFIGGGYPTEVQIEVSVDGINWIDKGRFAGVDTPTTWSQTLGETRARYLRFTVHSVVPAWGFFHEVYLSDISLIP